MHRITLSKVVGASALTLSLTLLPSVLPTAAQTSNNSTVDNSSSQSTSQGDRDFDWGWLGLIGLAGLAGLGGKKHDEPVRYRDPDPDMTNQPGPKY